MRILAVSAALVLASLSSPSLAAAQAASAPLATAAAPEDVASVEAIVDALYDVISGPAGPRDWGRLQSLFQPGAVMGSTGRGPDGSMRRGMTTPEGFAARNGEHFMTHAFYEREIGRRTSRFGPLVQIMSAYETLESPDGQPTERGVNSITLFDDGSRLWITSITWTNETAENPLPADLMTSH
ncbi:MAG: hypothetical protein EON90_05280 [Brevundimonas sp.]|nr:MAG: hypothetical protein EON90_05280 [Brevundimonas sp.]